MHEHTQISPFLDGFQFNLKNLRGLVSTSPLMISRGYGIAVIPFSFLILSLKRRKDLPVELTSSSSSDPTLKPLSAIIS